jgi:hypothetical protein
MISVLANYQPASQLLCPAFFSLFSAPSYRSQGHNKGKLKNGAASDRASLHCASSGLAQAVLDWLGLQDHPAVKPEPGRCSKSTVLETRIVAKSRFCPYPRRLATP